MVLVEDAMPFSSVVELSSLDGSNGFKISGAHGSACHGKRQCSGYSWQCLGGGWGWEENLSPTP